MIEWIRGLSAQYPRYGYRRIRIFLSRDGHAMSPGRAWPLWRLTKLQVPANTAGSGLHRRVRLPLAPIAANQVFMFDRCANGQQLKCPTGTDEFTRRAGDRLLLRNARSDDQIRFSCRKLVHIPFPTMTWSWRAIWREAAAERIS